MKSKKIPLASCLLSFLAFFTITSFLLPYIYADDEALSGEGASTTRSGIPTHLSLSLLLRRVSKNLKYDDLDTMLRTFHDSDSAKDFNPLYYIVNRRQSHVHHTKDIFNKYSFE